MTDAFLQQLFRSKWSGAQARGALPQIPISPTLPAADANHEGMLTWVKGDGSTTASIVYICLMSSTGTYAWKQVVSG